MQVKHRRKLRKSHAGCPQNSLDREIVSPGIQVSKLVAQRVFGNLQSPAGDGNVCFLSPRAALPVEAATTAS